MFSFKDLNGWISHEFSTKISVQSDGTSTWLSPITFQSMCKFDVTDFPYDTQRCNITFGPWSDDTTRMILHSNNLPVTTSIFQENSEWEVLSAIQYQHDELYKCCKSPFSLVIIELTMKRKPLYYFFHLILPCLFLISMVLIGHYVPPQSGERITLAITSTLAFIVMLEFTSAYLPRTNEISVISRLYIILIVQVSLSTLGTCFVLALYHRPKMMHTWIPIFLEKRFLPKSLWKETLESNGLVHKGNRRKRHSYAFVDKGSKQQIALKSMKRFNINNKDFKVKEPEEILRNFHIYLGKQNSTVQVLRVLRFYNDFQLKNKLQHNFCLRAMYAASILDTFLFWIFTLGMIIAIVATVLSHYW